MSEATRLQLYVFPGNEEYDFLSLDPQSLIAASYLQLLRPGQWEWVACTDTGLSHNGSLPFLKDGLDQIPASAILSHLLRQGDLDLDPEQIADSAAYHSLLDNMLLPLVLHSLYSLPSNWAFIRPLLSSAFPFPIKYYRPEQFRYSAKYIVDSTHPNWWGMGGEAEKLEEEERRKKRLLLETGPEAFKERLDAERSEGKQKMKNKFGEGKIIAAARKVFTQLESTLVASSTPYLFSSSNPTPIDAHLASLLQFALYLPLPLPILSDVIKTEFPRLWSHSALLRKMLWSTTPSPKASRLSVPSLTIASVASDFIPDGFKYSYWRGESLKYSNVKKDKDSKPSKKEEDFAKKRLTFFAIVAIGFISWGLGVGKIPMPVRSLIFKNRLQAEDEEWEIESGDEEDRNEEDLDVD